MGTLQPISLFPLGSASGVVDQQQVIRERLEVPIEGLGCSVSRSVGFRVRRRSGGLGF